MSYRGEGRTLEDRIALIEEQMRRTQIGLDTRFSVIAMSPGDPGIDLTGLATVADMGRVELLGWLGMVTA